MDWLLGWPDKYPNLALAASILWFASVAWVAWNDIRSSRKARAERKKLIEDFEKKLKNGGAG